MSKSPFVGYSVEEINRAEATTFVIQVGTDIFKYNGKYAFSYKSAVTFRNKILMALIDLINNGSKKQKKEAIDRLMWLRIIPLRIH